jgi:hypothetical protein
VAPSDPLPLATLSWGELRAEVAVEVIHRGRDGAGVRFPKIFDGAPKFLHALEDRYARALGSAGKKRKW